MTTSDSGLGTARWRGQPHRVEVWYATFTDADGTGYWLHYETVAPSKGDAYAHGWAAVFPADSPPTIERFGPETAPRVSPVDDDRLAGTAGAIHWDLSFADASAPLWTFPRFAWEREVLPAAQIVPWPRARIRGTFGVGATVRDVDAIGAVARIYGHGNAQRWCWLHADLGEGAVVELVAATPRRRGLNLLPMVALLQLRVPGAADWPRNSLLAAPMLHARHRADGFVVGGVVGRRRVGIHVTWPADRAVSLEYTDPDGATATCTNSERASVNLAVQKWQGRWTVERSWHVVGTAHAEIGRRP